jgi:hypothetical protein
MRQAQSEREDREVKGALTAYAINPDDETAFERLAQWRPDMAIQVRQDQDKRRQAAAVSDLQRRAAGGDRTAMAELAGIDLDAWDKISDNDRQRVQESASAIGQAALRISQLPEPDRPAAWDASVDQLSARFPDLAQYKGQYSPEALNSALDQAKLVNDFIRTTSPQEFNVGPGEGRYERDPITGAIKTVVAPNPGDAAPFSPVETGVSEGATATNPQTGEKVMFRNGEWVPAGGGASNGVGNFQ